MHYNFTVILCENAVHLAVYFFYGFSTTQLLLGQCHAYMYEYIKINVDADIV